MACFALLSQSPFDRTNNLNMKCKYELEEESFSNKNSMKKSSKWSRTNNKTCSTPL